MRRVTPLIYVLLFCLTAFLTATSIAVGAMVAQVSDTAKSISSDPWRDIEPLQLMRGVILPMPDPAAAPDAAGAVAPRSRLAGFDGRLARGERVNLLLIGYGGDGHSGAYLADSLMVASIDPVAPRVALLSVPRDLVVWIEPSRYGGGYFGKVNEAFAVGAMHGDRDEGIRVAKETVARATGVTLHRAVAVDFRAFRSTVDALGGIEVDVERTFSSLYPDDDHGWMTVSFHAGRQQMDGETALRYARARYSDGPEGSDFARAARQQQIIAAARRKAFSGDRVRQMFSLLDALRANVRTDLSVTEMQSLVDIARGYDDTRTHRVTLSPQNVLASGTRYVAGNVRYAAWPAQGWAAVRTWVRGELGLAPGEPAPPLPPEVPVLEPAPIDGPEPADDPPTAPVPTPSPAPIRDATPTTGASAPAATPTPSGAPVQTPAPSALATATPVPVTPSTPRPLPTASPRR